MDKIGTTGSCICGAVNLKADAVTPHVHACHCGMCRKWSGGPLLAVDCGTSVTFEGEDDISVYSSSDWAERGFCKVCGTHLFYRFKHNGQYFMPVGLLDGLENATMEGQVFIDRKPGYYTFANQTAHNMTEAEVFAMFSGGTASSS